MERPRLKNAVIAIEGLRLKAHHGVLEQETKVGNLFQLDISLSYPIEKAMTTDSIDDTLNYAELVEIAKRVMAVPSKLLENVVGRLQDAILAQFPAIEGGKIKLTKLTPPISAELSGVSVEIEW